MKKTGSGLTRTQKQATVQKWATWILKQQTRAAKGKERRP